MKTALALVLLTFALLASFAATSFTWVFRSGDSADFLAMASWWYVGHVEGSPTLLLLGHALNLLPGALPMKLTLAYAVVPASLTVGLIYLFAHRSLHLPTGAATVAALAYIASAIVWSQSTLLMQYALVTFLGFLGLYLWYGGARYVAGVALALAIGVHFLGLIFAGAVFFPVWWQSRKEGFLPWDLRGYWIRPVAVCVAMFVALYALIPVLMLWPGIPRWIAGPFSLGNVYSYFFEAQGFVGGLPVVQVPERTWHLFGLLLVSWGPLWVPALVGAWCLRRTPLVWLALAPVVLWWTFLDTATWTWMVASFPVLCLFLAIGLSRLPRWHTYLASLVVAGLLLVNGVSFNTRVIAQADGRAETFLAELGALPVGSIAMVMESDLSTTLAYFNATHPNGPLVPLISPKYERYEWHRQWVEAEYGLRQVTAQSAAAARERELGGRTNYAPLLREVLEDGRPVYLMGYPGLTNVLEACETEKSGQFTYRIRRCES